MAVYTISGIYIGVFLSVCSLSGQHQVMASFPWTNMPLQPCGLPELHKSSSVRGVCGMDCSDVGGGEGQMVLIFWEPSSPQNKIIGCVHCFLSIFQQM